MTKTWWFGQQDQKYFQFYWVHFSGIKLLLSNHQHRGDFFKGVCLSDCLPCDKIITLNKNTNNHMGVNQTVQQSATSTAIDNTSFEFGHPVMSAASTRKRRYVPSKRKRVPDKPSSRRLLNADVLTTRTGKQLKSTTSFKN